ncbi:hypothetical protein SBA4_720004 [Candidatus Sulfopaludibacter sp. SbA4]|nr:hypothetical protein SBA4_720004 [Candidatus Sulfopaludibacter sp. SbA4]
MSQFLRQESPPHFEDHREYRPYLRRDFRYVCAYCERTEAALGGEEFFEIDHFRPRVRFPDLVTHYPNLYYACGRCNRHKGGKWPPPDLLAKGFRFADPCAEDMYVSHLRETADGYLRALTACGEYTRDQIGLNRPVVVNWRLERRSAATEARIMENTVAHLEILLATVSDLAARDEVQQQLATIRLQIARLRKRFSL